MDIGIIITIVVAFAVVMVLAGKSNNDEAVKAYKAELEARREAERERQEDIDREREEELKKQLEGPSKVVKFELESGEVKSSGTLAPEYYWSLGVQSGEMIARDFIEYSWKSAFRDKDGVYYNSKDVIKAWIEEA